MAEPVAHALSAKDLEPLIRRLDVMIALVVRAQPKTVRTGVSDRIRLLSEMGLDSPEIARVVGRGTNYIGAVLGGRPSKGREVQKKKSGKKTGTR